MVTKHREISGLCIKAFYNVYNELGYGFAEKVYHNAMIVELRRLGLTAEKEQEILVSLRGEVVGEFYADIIVSDVIILELKAVQQLIDQHEAQLLNYLRSTTYGVGLLMSFGPKPEFQRKLYDNPNKGNMSWLNN